MELHAIEAHGLVERVFLFVWEDGADLGAEGIGTLADVPGSEGEAVLGWFAHGETQ
jgi:hypothetical protein